jgi:alanine racemase
LAPRALARVNLAAVEHNVGRLRACLSSSTSLCAVVKADGYGHGATAVATAALRAGATSLAVATAGEAAALRSAGITAPVLVLGALGPEELAVALRARAELVVWSAELVDALARGAGGDAPTPRDPLRLHVKLDTGMGRLGTRDPEQALAIARAIAAAPGLKLAGAMTHLATADDPDPSFMRQQLARFAPFARAVRALEPGAIAHAANSAATLREPASHHQMVRCGIAIYGLDPFNEDPAARGLEPALELHSYVAAVKLARPGESAGYGRRFIARRATWIATVPIGYADGIPRALSDRGEVLIGGRRFPLAGTVSMDNITVALGDRPAVAVGERVVIIGPDGEQRLTIERQARAAQTINYELACRISARVPRIHHRDGEEALAT